MSPKEQEAYNEALAEIEACRKSGEQSLELFGIGLTQLPPEIGQLKDLRLLELRYNYLTSLPPEIGQLTTLTELYLGMNQLTSLPPEIGQLTSLTELHLSKNQLTSLPPEIGQLTALTGLYIDKNQLTSLPSKIGQLIALTRVHLHNNYLTSLPLEIGQLTALTELQLSNNQLTSLPPEIGQLIALTELSLGSNQLTNLPPEIGQLTALTGLYLWRNRLTSLPPEIGRLDRLERLILENCRLHDLPDTLRGLRKLKDLSLHGNEDLGLPPEVLGLRWATSGESDTPEDPRAILDYYFDTLGKAGEALREMRVIVVGHAKVGKTTLVRRLAGDALRKDEKETHGINILPITLMGKKGAWQTRFWDFGGQHVLHAMHEFFLTKRCLYLLVLEQRQDQTEKDARYWLQLIRGYAGMDAPVIVALNQSRGVARPLATDALEAEYGKVLAWIPTECLPETDSPGAQGSIDGLKARIIEALDSAPEQRFPRKWARTKSWLENLKKPWVTYEAYEKQCEQDEPDALRRADLAELMNDLGIAINYARDPRLRERTVLRPGWLADGIYALLRANMLQKVPLAPGGVLRAALLPAIFQAAEESEMLKVADYSPGKNGQTHKFLLRLMGLFGLSFPLDDKPDGDFLVPALLNPNEKTNCPEPGDKNRIRVRWEMHVVPAPLMGRLMVALFALLDTDKLWLHGCCLRYATAKGRLWMKAGADNRIYVTVGSPPGDTGHHHRNELLQMIRLALWRVAGEYTHLWVKEEWEWEIGKVRDFVSCDVLKALPDSLVTPEVQQMLQEVPEPPPERDKGKGTGELPYWAGDRFEEEDGKEDA